MTVGAALAVAAGRLLQALRFDTSPTDAVTFTAAIALGVVMTIAGSLLPAVRAARVDPVEVMRAE